MDNDVNTPPVHVPPVQLDVGDVVDTPWPVGECYAFARLLLARYGHHLPETQAAALLDRERLMRPLLPGEPCRALDLVEMRDDAGPHLGVVAAGVPAARVCHAGNGSIHLSRLAVLERLGMVTGISRLLSVENVS